MNIPSGFLEKFEEHFGPRRTKGMLLFIAIIIVVVGLALIYSWAIKPAIDFLRPVLKDASFPSMTTAIPLWTVLLFFFAVGVSIALVRFLYKRGEESSRIRRLDNLTSQLDLVLSRLNTHAEKETFTRARDAFMDGILSTSTYSEVAGRLSRDPISGRFIVKPKERKNPPPDNPAIA